MTLPPLVSTESALLVLAALVSLVLLHWLDQRLQRQARAQERFLRAAGRNHRVSGPLLALSRQMHTLIEIAADLAQKLRFLGSGNRSQTKILLESAGFRGTKAVARYFGAKLIACVVGALAALAAVGQGTFAGNSPMQAALLLAGFFVGGLLPEFVCKHIASRRRAVIRAFLADAIDLLIIATNAGQSLEVALTRVAAEMSRTAPALADELQVTTHELRALPNRRQALENFAVRSGVPEARSLTATLIQTIRYGTPLTQSLKVLAAEQRSAKLLRLEEKAAKLPAILSLPLMLLIMPSIFIVTAGPAMLNVGDALFGS